MQRPEIASVVCLVQWPEIASVVCLVQWPEIAPVVCLVQWPEIARRFGARLPGRTTRLNGIKPVRNIRFKVGLFNRKIQTKTSFKCSRAIFWITSNPFHLTKTCAIHSLKLTFDLNTCDDLVV